MNTAIILIGALVVSLLICSCEPLPEIEPLAGTTGVNTSSSGSVIYIDGTFRTAADTWQIPPQGQLRFAFDKRKQSLAKNIEIMANLWADDVTNICTIRLYNYTDNIVVSDSEMTTDKGGARIQKKVSKNIIGHIPNKKVELGVQIKSLKNGKFVNVSNATVNIRY